MYYYVMIIYGKITTIKKIQGLDSFLSTSKGNFRIFIGNDINDREVMEFVGYPLCPSDAHYSIKNISISQNS